MIEAGDLHPLFSWVQENIATVRVGLVQKRCDRK
jgi:hypothetical protein